MTTIPNPGSNKAIQQGCTCPVWDNHYGQGIPCDNGRLFVMNEGCPLHGKDAKTEKKDGQP